MRERGGREGGGGLRWKGHQEVSTGVSAILATLNKHRVNFHICLGLHSHCTKINFHIWKSILNYRDASGKVIRRLVQEFALSLQH